MLVGNGKKILVDYFPEFEWSDNDEPLLKGGKYKRKSHKRKSHKRKSHKRRRNHKK